MYNMLCASQEPAENCSKYIAEEIIMKEYAITKSFTHAGRRYFVRGDSEADVARKIALKKRDLEEGRVTVGGSMRFSDWAKICIDTYKTGATQRTRENFIYVVKHYVSQYIGDMPLNSIRPLHCQNALNAAAGLSQYTINQINIAMNFIFDRAVDNNLLLVSPARNLRKPKGTKTARRSLTDYEQEIFLRAADSQPRFIVFELMYYCGCRPSEARAAMGFDIIERDGVHLLHVRGTKTPKSDRFVPLPDKLYLKAETTPRFANIALNAAGNPMDERSYRRAWNSLCREMNILMGCRVYRNELIPPYPLADDLTPYCLRHTYCTNLQRQGIDIRLAQYLMGHADIKMTANIYTHNDINSAVTAAKSMPTVSVGVTPTVAPEPENVGK